MKKLAESAALRIIAFAVCVCAAAFAAHDAVRAGRYIFSWGGFNDSGSFEEYSPVLNRLGLGCEYLMDVLHGRDYSVVSGTLEDIEYYGINYETDKTFSNTDKRDRGSYTRGENSTYVVCEYKDGMFNMEGNNYAAGYCDPTFERKGEYAFYVKLTDEAAERFYNEWSGNIHYYRRVMISVPLCILAYVIGLIYLSFAAGRRRGKEDIAAFAVDKIPFDFHIASVAVLSVVTLFITAGLMSFEGEILRWCGIAAIVTGGLYSAAVTAIYMSMVRNIKNNTLCDRWLLARAVRYILKLLRRGARFLIRTVPERIKAAGVFIIDTAKNHASSKLIISAAAGCAGLMTIFAAFGGVFGFVMCAAAGFAGVYAAARATDGFDKLREGLQRIRNGETGYKIENCRSVFAQKMAEDINSVGDGIEKAVAQSVRSERMKAELVTNVSHDLKTPLTSIINYSDLLMKTELSPDEANDYVKIISQKSRKLKQLTSDLFDISKAQSGNEEIDTETIDYKLLISQALAENEGELNAASIETVLRMPDEKIEIETDAKKLSRVYENLIINAARYSMRGTRLYIDMFKKDGCIVTEVKNIAGYKMDFAGDEITERFVRGDESRSDGGNGLGLAIAKSYTELLGGRFFVTTDGDLFKASIIVPE